MNDKQRQHYSAIGLFDYEKIVEVRRKLVEARNLITHITSELHLVGDGEVLQIEERFHQAFVAAMDLDKLLSAKLDEFREKFGGRNKP